MGKNKNDRELSSAMQQIVDIIADFDDEQKVRLLSTVSTFFELSLSSKGKVIEASLSDDGPDSSRMNFSDQKDISPKEFLFQKHPKTDVERVACLAYYLTHHMGVRHFKTVDISTLNTDAAQLKFSNTAYAVNNATRAGLLVPAVKGKKQLSSIGERYVEALPDSHEAKSIVARMKKGKIRKTKRKKTGK